MRVSLKAKELANRSLVRPKLEYDCNAWDLYAKQRTDQIEMIQRRAAHYSRFNHVTHIIEHLGWVLSSPKETWFCLINIHYDV